MTIWRMRIVFWIPRTKNTHSEYVMLIALPPYQWLQERTSMLRCTYIACCVMRAKNRIVTKLLTSCVAVSCAATSWSAVTEFADLLSEIQRMPREAYFVPFLDTVVRWDRALRRQLDLLYWVLMIDGQIWNIAGQIISRIKPTFHRNTLQLACGVHLWDGRSMWHVWRRASYKVLVGEPDVKRPLLRPSHRLEDNIKKYIQEIGWEDVDWIDVAQDRAK